MTMEEMRQSREEMREIAENIRSTTMKRMEAQEQERQSADLLRESLTHRLEDLVQSTNEILNAMRKVADQQWEQAGMILNSAKDTLRISRELLQKASDKIEKLNGTGGYPAIDQVVGSRNICQPFSFDTHFFDR